MRRIDRLCGSRYRSRRSLLIRLRIVTGRTTGNITLMHRLTLHTDVGRHIFATLVARRDIRRMNGGLLRGLGFIGSCVHVRTVTGRVIGIRLIRIILRREVVVLITIHAGIHLISVVRVVVALLIRSESSLRIIITLPIGIVCTFHLSDCRILVRRSVGRVVWHHRVLRLGLIGCIIDAGVVAGTHARTIVRKFTRGRSVALRLRYRGIRSGIQLIALR